MKPQLADLRFFLGGNDLEMITIRDLLKQHAAGQFEDDGLAWGAKATDIAIASSRLCPRDKPSCSSNWWTT